METHNTKQGQKWNSVKIFPCRAAHAWTYWSSLYIWELPREKTIRIWPANKEWPKNTPLRWRPCSGVAWPSWQGHTGRWSQKLRTKWRFWVPLIHISAVYRLVYKNLIQLNLSTTATMGTEESDRCREDETRVTECMDSPPLSSPQKKFPL